jgi:hypothetical protein
MKYDLSAIMTRAWSIFHKLGVTFAEALHRAWQSAKARPQNEETILKAKEAAGVTEEAHTWAEWKERGYEVVHGSKALFRAVLIWASRGDGRSRTAAFFGASQVQPLAAE